MRREWRNGILRRIVAARKKGIAAKNAPNPLDCATHRAVFLYRQNHVGAARRLKTAHRWQKRAKALLVKQHQSDQET